MDYIKCEFRRIFDIKTICIGIAIITFVSFIFGKFIPSDSTSILLGILYNVNLIFLIACGSILATEDFELGTFKSVFTGKYSFTSIIIMKLIIYMLISLFLSLILSLVTLSNGIFTDGYIRSAFLKENLLKTIVVYLCCGLTMFSFSQLFGLLFKNFSLNLIIMFGLFYGVLSELINLFSNSPQGTLSKISSFLPFSVVPKMMINGELNYFNVSLLTGYSVVILLLIILCQRIWFR